MTLAFPPGSVRSSSLLVAGAGPAPAPPPSALTGAIRAFGDLCAEVERFDDLGEFLDMVVRTTVAVLGYDYAMVLATDVSGRSRARGSHGLSADYLRHTRVLRRPEPAGWSPVREALDTGQPSFVGNVEAEPRLSYFQHPFRSQGVRACGSFPLRHGDGSVGVLTIYLREPHEFTQAEAELVSAVTGLAGAIVATAVLRRDRELGLADLRAVVDRLERSEAIRRTLSDVVSAGGGIAGVAATLSEMVGGQVVVEDLAGHILAGDGPVPAPRSPGVRGRTALPAAGRRLRKRPVVVGGSEIAMVVASAAQLCADELLDEALGHGTAMLAMLLAAGGAGAEDRETIDACLLDDICGVRDASASEELLGRASRLGYRLRDGFDLFVIGPTERLPAAVRRRLLESIRTRLADLAPGSLVATSGDVVVVLLPVAAGSGQDPCEVAEMLASAGVGMPEGVRPRVVIAGRCPDLTDAAELCALGESLIRLTGIDRTAGRGSADVIDGRALGIRRILTLIPDATQLLDLRDRIIGPLIDYDREHRTDLLATLACYFRQGLRAKETARELIVHVNSLTYRLRRVEEVLGAEIRGGPGMLQLQFAVELESALRGCVPPRSQRRSW